MDIILLPFTEVQAPEVASWVLSADEARAWAGRNTTFPFLADQIQSWHDDPDVHPFIARDDDDLMAYGELWVDRTEEEIELARIIVNPRHRGIGIGRAFVAALVYQAATYRLVDIFMRVTPDNGPAIRCYQSSGFARVSTTDEKKYNQGQPIDYVWLKYAS